MAEQSNSRLVDWDNLRISLFFIYSGEVQASGRGTKEIPGATAWLVERGWARVTDETGTTVGARSGQWLMVRPGVRQQAFSDDVQLLSINFLAALVTGESLFYEGLSLVLKGHSHPMLEKQARILLKTASRILGADNVRSAIGSTISLSHYLALQRDLFSWVIAWNGALQAAGLVPTRMAYSDPRIGQAANYLQAHLRDVVVDAKTIADEVGLSINQLNRQFQRERNETLNQCHQRQRKELAQLLLMRTAMSIKEIAIDLGFSHQSHFTKWFTRQVGMTPSAFRGNPVGNRYFPLPKKK